MPVANDKLNINVSDGAIMSDAIGLKSPDAEFYLFVPF
jgi:hypothetical protein